MKLLLAGVFLGLALLSVLAWAMVPAPPQGTRTPLVWVSDNNPQRVPQIERFNRLYPDCFLSLDPNNAGVQKVIVQACAGVGPEIIDVYGIQQLQTFVDAGILLDVTEVAKRRGFDPSATYPRAGSGLMVDGRQYGFPCNVNVDVIFFNKNLFEKYGVPFPPRSCSWEELLEIAKSMTLRPPGSKLPECFGLANADWQELIRQKGGHVFSEDGTRCVVDSPEAIEGIRFYRDLMHKHNVIPSPLQKAALTGEGGWGQGWLNWFGAQRIAMIKVGKWGLITFRMFQKEQEEAKEKWIRDHKGQGQTYSGPEPLHLSACHVPYFEGQPKAVLLGSRVAAINALSPRAGQAVNFLEYLTTRDYCETINEGADALPGNGRYGTVVDMHNEGYPEEDIANELTLEATEWGVVKEISPFVDAGTAVRLIEVQIQRIESDPDLDPARAMTQAARDVNEQIMKNINRDPQLRERYARVSQEGSRP